MMMSRSEPVVVQYGASTSGSRPEENYDVFINFRGPDVRTGFVKELNESLRSAGIGPFLDSYDINHGEDCWASIEKAIRGAPICICVFSPKYAESQWCLKELAFIWKLRSDKLILPIFYNVEPMHLRDHAIDREGPFYQGMKKMIERVPEADVSTWKVVLDDISKIRGEVLDTNSTEDPEHNSRLEARVVRKLVKDVQKRLESRYPVAIDQRASHIIQVLQRHSGEACTMGMWGMGGVGKTTLATKIYDRMKENYKANYKATSFLKDVARRAAEKNGALEALQTQLLFDLSGNKELVNVVNVDQGKILLQQCLQSKQVLIVVDNVEDEAVTNALCIDEYLGIGSCCLVTSRSSEVCSTFRTTCVNYEVELLQSVDARQLFCWHAFEESIFPREGFQELASKISSACGGLPLVLETIGSLLKGEKDIRIWEEVLVNLQLHEALEYDDRVFNQLKLSFDSLEAREKDMFLDVACFFLGTDEDLAIETWESWRGSPWVCLRNLKRKCLLKVEKSCLTMHDLFVDMGHKIVTMESRVDPGERSRLWMDDSEQMILANMTTKKTVTFSLAGSKTALMNLDFKDMKNLRLLNLDGCSEGIAHSEQEKDLGIRDNLPACNNALPQLLRHIKWHRMPTSELPSRVYGLQWLVVLDFTGSKMKRLWHPSSDVTFPGLRALILVDCTALSELPNSLTRSSQIRKLNMSGCSALGMMPPDIGCLKELVFLDLQGCLKLEQLPESMGGLTSLIRLNLQNCSNLKSLPESIGSCVSLRLLILAGCLGLVRLPYSVGGLRNLRSLLASGCNRLTDFPESMKELSSLKNLFLGGGELKAVPLFIEHLAGTLECLHIHNSKIKSLPEFVSKLTKLQIMDFCGCYLLQSVPESINDLTDLRRLNFCGCVGLEKLPNLISNLQNLEELNLECCEQLKNLPNTLGQLKNLQILKLYVCKGLVEFPKPESLREPFSESCCQRICEFIQFRCEQNMMLRGDYIAAEKDLNFIKLNDLEASC
ncbi:hypothetical protein KC19_7G168100 [Ceratodon purpureus]|uniref:TIR domain-containing protein n=1 Tax=Ceratodon purpureus TaxID=3225 RepID=A0A8T0HCJ6_CERPU|nr:hypothetical protein KC19_7G168100 [Ceratodon purpureus]